MIGAVDIGGTKIAVGMVDDSWKGVVEAGVSDRRSGRVRKRTGTNDRHAAPDLSGCRRGDFRHWNRFHRGGVPRRAARLEMSIYCRDGRETIRCKTWRANSR